MPRMRQEVECGIIRGVMKNTNAPRGIVFFGLALLLLVGTALAEDFWVKKEYTQWNDEEIKKLLTNSPWAKQVNVTAPPSAFAGAGRGEGAAAGPGNSGIDVSSKGGGGGRRPGGGGGGGEAEGGGGASGLQLSISWRSSLPLKKALVKSRAAGDTIPPELQQILKTEETNYVIVLTGVPLTYARTIQNTDQVKLSVIKRNKKPPIALAGIEMQQRTRSVDVIYVFPRTDRITEDEKEVEVVLRLGAIEAKHKFNLKDMVVDGKLEL